MSNPLSTTLEAKLDKLQQNFADAVKMADEAVHKIEEGFKNSNPDASGFIENFKQSAEAPAKAAGAAIAAIIAAAIGGSALGFAALIKTVEGLSALGDRSDDLRLSVNLLQALGVAADQARVPQEKLNRALDKFTEVSKKSDEDAKNFYKALGNISTASVEAFKNADTQQQRLRILSDAFKSTTDEVKRAQLAEEAFGSDNERLIGLFAKGSQGIDDYIAKAKALGLEINESMVKQAQAARGELTLLARVLSDQFSTALADLIPLLNKILPLLQGVAVGARAIAGIFSSDETASVGQLSSELDGLVDQWVRLKTARDNLSTEKPAKFEALRDDLRGILGINSSLESDIKAVDDDIAKVQARIDTVKKLIASRNAEAAKPDNAPPAFEQRDSLDADEKKKKDAFTREVDTINRRIAALDAQTAAVGRGTEAQALYYANGQLIEALNRAGITITPEYAARIDGLSRAYAQAALKAAEAAQKFQQQQQFFQFAGDQAISIIDGIRNKSLTASQALAQLANAFINAAEKALLLGQGPLAGLFGTAPAPGTGQTGGLIGGVAGLFGRGGGTPSVGGGNGGEVVWITPGGNAGGTDDWRGGISWVGEKGPELVNLPRGAQVFPSEVSRGMASGGSQPRVVINNYGQDVQTQGNNTDEIEVTVRGIVRDEMGSSRANVLGKKRFGLEPVLRQRG